MGSIWKVGIAEFLSLLFLGSGLAFAGMNKIPLVTTPSFDKLSLATTDLASPSKTKPLNLISVISTTRDEDLSVSPAIHEQLFNAVEVEDLERAERLLIGLDINLQDKRGITPLYKSIFHNRFNFVRLLLERGADVNLLDQGTELEAKDSFGYTPLHLATDQGSVKVAHALIERGANVNNSSEWGNTPLHASTA